MLTNHARKRMAEKGITLAQVRRVVERGYIEKIYGTFYCWDNELVVIVRQRDPVKGRRWSEDYTIITVFEARGRGKGFTRLRERWLKELSRERGD